MSTRERPRSRSEESASYDDEFGLVTDADIEAYLADQAYEEESEAKAGFLNLQTVSGMGLIGLGVLYSLQQIGLFGIGSTILSDLAHVLPVLAAILIILTGFGVLSWSPAARRRRKARERATKLRRRERKTMGRGTTADPRTARAFDTAERTLRTAGREAGRLAAEAGRAAGDAFRESRQSRPGGRAGSSPRTGAAKRRLTRKVRERKLTGVAAGMAAYFGLDPTIVRIAWVVATIFSGGNALIPYIILSFVLPKDDTRDPLDSRSDDPVIRISDD